MSTVPISLPGATKPASPASTNQGGSESNSPFIPLDFQQLVGWMLAGMVSFHIAYAWPVAAALVILYLFALWELSKASSVKRAFYCGFLFGFSVFVPQLSFFWTIFGPGAIALWSILSAWTALFVAVLRACRGVFKPAIAAVLAPVLWAGIEYFRSELYYLRFSWINAGYAFHGNLPDVAMNWLGVYGVSFLLMLVVAVAGSFAGLRRWVALAAALLLTTLATLAPKQTWDRPSAGRFTAAGIQLEGPMPAQVLMFLDRVITKHPETQLLVLSEYTFFGPVPQEVMDWCRMRERYLVVGAKEMLSGETYYNTAFVIGPAGKVVFKQAKQVPIQFFADGLPAPSQSVWESPWGRLGFCVCYDLSYTRVTDELIRQGAQAIIVPTMDVTSWGAYQHALHARIAPVRASEYGVPIFRLCSSGISQNVTASGVVTATAPFPGQRELIVDTVNLSQQGTLPWDRSLGPLSAIATGLTILGLLLRHLVTRHRTILPS